MSNKLTLNLGARYDLSLNANGNNYAVPPFVDKGRPADKNNIQPRAGFAYRVTNNTVVRGGTGVYFSTPLQIDTFFMAQIDRLVVIQYTNDGRPDFGANPTNGQPLPSVAQGQQQFCHVRNVPGCLRRSLQELVAPERILDAARSHVAELHRLPAPDREHGGGRGGLRLQPGPQREGHHLEHEPDVQPGDRRELSVLRHRASRLSRFRRHLDARAHGPFELSRAADGRDEAVQQPLAGLRHLHAVWSLGRLSGRVQRHRARADPDHAGPGWRVVALLR